MSKNITLKLTLTPEGLEHMRSLQEEACCGSLNEVLAKSLSLFETVLNFQNTEGTMICRYPDGRQEELQHVLTIGS